jgi:nucleotide-binding universal stress UspA family protein
MKILFATDGSEYSEGAAKLLTRFNFSPVDEIVILHAISWMPILSNWESLLTDFREIRDEVVPKILDSASSILKDTGAKISSTFIEDYPERAIIDMVKTSDIDLIVMGARGLRGFTSLVVGSVTKTVAVKAARPVLVIRPPQTEKSGRIKLLFATDGSPSSEATGKIIAAIPFPEDSEAAVINVLDSAFEDIPERFSMEIDERMKNIVAKMRQAEFKESENVLATASELLGTRFTSIQKFTKQGDPPNEIISAAEEMEADIIAVGSSGKRGLGRLGSVSRYILHHANCSVLIGRE